MFKISYCPTALMSGFACRASRSFATFSAVSVLTLPMISWTTSNVDNVCVLMSFKVKKHL